MSKNYYDILGVSKNAGQEEIKQAFRKLAHQHHPDKAGGNEEKFKEINEAYQVLGNPEKRQQYDQYGQTFEQARQQGGFAGFEGFRDFSDFAEAFRNGGGQNFSFGDLGDIFSEFFGGGRTKTRTRGGRTGADIGIDLMLEFREAVFGTEKAVNLTKEVACDYCGGSGNEPGSKMKTCSACRGRGQVTASIGFGIGFAQTCQECGGSGEVPEKKCARCHSRGVARETKEIKIKIPAGIDDEQSIRLSGYGNAGSKGAPAGDLYVTVHVQLDKEFKREGFDILTEAAIPISLAVLGGKIDINTLDGTVKLKIPEGTESGKVFRLRGYGVPHLQHRGRGDQLIKVIIKIPTRLSRKQKELFEELGKEER